MKNASKMAVCALAFIVFALTLNFASVSALGITTNPGILAGPITNPANNHDYYILEFAEWTIAEAKAVELGGHLVTINDADENEWVRSTVSTQMNANTMQVAWIGLSDFAQEGNYVWSSGEDVTYLNWYGNEPNNSGGNEDYCSIWLEGNWGGGWNDGKLNNMGYTAYGMVEVVPGSVSLEVILDIRPGNESSPINLKSKGVLPVTILGSEELDVSQIDLSSLLLAGASPQERGNSGQVASIVDQNGDSVLDLNLKFDLEEMDIAADASELFLTGLLLDGTAIEGADAIRMVPVGNGIDDPLGPAATHAIVLPEPMTMSLLLVGGVAMLRRRKN